MKNRFVFLSSDQEASVDHSTNEMYESATFQHLRSATEPQTLIIGVEALFGIKPRCSRKHTKALCFANDMVSDISVKV